MIINNGRFNRGKYNSYLVDYLENKVNYDRSLLIYNSKYGKPSFTINMPNSNYRNCDFISGYPHFDIPTEVLINEINNFISSKPLYDFDFVIRYGDIHPNKPYPMLGQTRNLYLGNLLKNMILSTKSVEDIFTIGDISEKSISVFFKSLDINTDVNEFIRAFLNIDEINKFESLSSQYSLFCKESLIKTKELLSKLNLEKNNYLMESQLYSDTDLFKKISAMQFDNGLKNNGMLKYFLQEFMFLLNESYKEKCILNIIGSDQSTHIKKVLKVIDDNHLDINANFVSYGICKNSGLRDVKEWMIQLDKIIKSKNLKINDEYLEPFDFLKFYYLFTGTDTILDFDNVNNYSNNFLTTIVDSIKKSSQYTNNSDKIESSLLLCKMALANQQLDTAITSGNPSKLLRYTYDIASEYMRNEKHYENISNLYFDFMNTMALRLNIQDTEPFQKVLKRR